MKRLNLTQVHTFSMAVGAVAVAFCFTAGAQTTTTVLKPPVKKVATPVHAVKTTAPATPTTASQKTQTAAPVVIPASSQTVIPSSTPGSTAVPTNSMNGLTSSGSTVAPTNMVNGLSSTGSTALSNTVNGLSSAGTNAVGGLSSAGTNAVNGMVSPGSTAAAGQTFAGSPSNGVPAGDTRSPVGGLGVGSFVFQGWTLTAYGCFRTGTRLFCDFDTSYVSNFQAATNIWGPVNLVDDGGKITLRHNAFFVGDDGSQFQIAYLTANKPARFIIEYDDVNQRYTSISLVCGRDQIQAVPITLMDPNQAAGTMPARASARGTR